MEKKEAMKILKEFHDKSTLFSVRTALDTVIPELKESENEKIRKELLDYLKHFIPHHDIDLVTKSKKWITWLEKQGDKDKLIQELGKYKVKYTQEVLSQQLEKQEEEELTEFQRELTKVFYTYDLSTDKNRTNIAKNILEYFLTLQKDNYSLKLMSRNLLI